jgi:hypothetical protein
MAYVELVDRPIIKEENVEDNKVTSSNLNDPIDVTPITETKKAEAKKPAAKKAEAKKPAAKKAEAKKPAAKKAK